MGKKGADFFADHRRGRAARDAAFTLTEMMVVLVIIGVISALSLPYMGRDRKSLEAREFAGELAKTLQVARQTAVSERLPIRAFIFRDRIELRSHLNGATPGAPTVEPTVADPVLRVVLARTATEVVDVRAAAAPVPTAQVLSTTTPAIIDFRTQGQMEFDGQPDSSSAFIFVRKSDVPVGVRNRLFRVDVRALTGHVAVRQGWD
jgi:prepilin-type N-terminal cleavage/methylation domain-containing protein